MTRNPKGDCLTLICAMSGAICLTLAGPGTGPVLAADKPSPTAPAGWDRQAAAHYLDSREVWWQSWDRTQKDHGTYCISCHTQAPYAMARPVLRKELGEPAPTGAERAMLTSIEKRVRMWKEVEPFYLDAKYGTGKEIESRNAEAVLNAVILAGYDARESHLSETTRTAFENAWALQAKTGPDAGAWVWQNFGFTPWESKESQYHWAALMAVAVGNTPGQYRKDQKIATSLALLRGFIQSHYDAQPLLNKVVGLWASASMPDLLWQPQKAALVAELVKLQHDDGGWSLTDLGTWERRDKTPLETRSDGYATGLVVLVLQETSLSNAHGRRSTDPCVARGIDWLIANQDKTTGAWPAWSLNKNRDPKSEIGHFMSDAATGYAVLAILKAQR